MRRLALIAASVAALAGATATSAQGQGIFILVTDGPPPLTTIETKVRITGAVTVDFHGDAAAGCAAAGLCGVSGTVVWDPSGPGQLFAFSHRSHGLRFEGAFLTFGSGDYEAAQPTTSARVRRASEGGPSAGALCADAGSQSFQLIDSNERPGSSVELGLVSSPGSALPVTENFRTRCAGPLSGDVASLLPRRLVSERTLRRGGGRLDYSADGTFSAGGLTGTVHSDVVMHLGRTTDLLAAEREVGPIHTHPLRRREIIVRYRVEHVSGQVVTGVQGLADPDLCGPLDACGLMGAVTTTTSASSGSALVAAEAPLRRSASELRRAVGIAPGGAPSGIHPFGSAFWEHDGGTISSALTRDGDDGCSDTQPTDGPGALLLTFSGDLVRARYGDQDAGGGRDPLRTRCPGPPIQDVSGRGALATGTVPLSAFRHKRITLRLTTGHPYSADGYRGSTRPDITVVLRRTSIKQDVQVIHVPDGIGKLLARRLP